MGEGNVPAGSEDLGIGLRRLGGVRGAFPPAPRIPPLQPCGGTEGMKFIVLLGLVAHAAASPSVVAPFRQRPSARQQAVTLRGGLGKEAPSRQATAPFAALVVAHGVVIAGYGGGPLGLGAGSALVACAAVSLSEVYKPYMVGVHVALLVQGSAVLCRNRGLYAGQRSPSG